MTEKIKWYHYVLLEDGANSEKPTYEGWISTDNPLQITDSFFINKSEQDSIEQGYFVADLLKDKMVDDNGKPIDASHIYEENNYDDEFPLQCYQSWLIKDKDVPTAVKNNCTHISYDEHWQYWRQWNREEQAQ